MIICENRRRKVGTKVWLFIPLCNNNIGMAAVLSPIKLDSVSLNVAEKLTALLGGMPGGILISKLPM